MDKIRASELFLRPVRIDDAAQFAFLCNDPAIARNTARIPHPYMRADAEKFVARRGAGMFGGDGEFVFAVCRNDEIVACAGATRTSPGVFEIGYWVGADYRGRGVATGAASAVTQFAFVRLSATSVTAGFFADNPTSGRVLERVGFKPTGETILMHSVGRGEEVETVRLSLPRADFRLRPEIVITASES